MNSDFFLKFWGVRGSLACPGPETLRYGGNTSCIEIVCGNRIIILDAGTGIRQLGNEIVTKQRSQVIDLLLSHTHIDHINGFPFFKPAYDKHFKLNIHAGHLANDVTIESVFRKMMEQPFFPISVDIMSSVLKFNDFKFGEEISLGDGINIKTAALNHPNGATGYRIEYEGKSICYCTDTEHFEGRLDENILNLIRGADIFIYDSNFTDDEYSKYKGWGHSTWQEGVKLANAAGVRTFVAFHHDPAHDDVFMDKIYSALQRARAGSIVAQEGMVLLP